MKIITQIDKLLNDYGMNICNFIKKYSPEQLQHSILDSATLNRNDAGHKMISDMLEWIDDQILKSEWRKERYIPKGFYKRTIIFSNGVISFKRRKYMIKKEYQKNKIKYVFLLDVKIGLEKYQRLDFLFAMEIIKKLGVNFSYTDIANNYKNASITKQTVFNLIKRFETSDLLARNLEENDTKLTHKGFIYVETDEGYRNARCYQKATNKIIKKSKRMRLTVIHTGFVDPNAKRKKMNNVRYHFTMSDEGKSINTKLYWKAIQEFIKNNYASPETAEIMVSGDGGKYIPLAEKTITCKFAMDRFHIIKKIKDCILGNRAYKRMMSGKISCAILKLRWAKVRSYILEAWNWAKKASDSVHKLSKIKELIKYLLNFYKFINRWKHPHYIGCRIESYIGRFIKVMFRSKQKIFNEKTIHKVMLMKAMVSNGIDVYKICEDDYDERVESENNSYRWRFKKINKDIDDGYAMPILSYSKNTNSKKMIRRLVYNY